MRFRTIPSFYFKAISSKGKVVVYLVLFCLINTSCIKKLNLYQGDKDDACYFVGMLKESDKKDELLKRIK